MLGFFFFFSSRRRHTRSLRDWSSDVCSSDLDTIGEWKNDPRKSQITIRQLLNQTDGIEPAPHLHSESIRDRNIAAIQLPLVAAPGSAFAYGPSHLQIFAEVLRRKLNGRSTISYLNENVLSPLGL